MVSLASSFVLDVTPSRESLTKRRKGTCPKTDPWSPPGVIGTWPETSPSTTICWVPSDKKILIQASVLHWMPYLSTVCMNLLLAGLSKALLKSMKLCELYEGKWGVTAKKLIGAGRSKLLPCLCLCGELADCVASVFWSEAVLYLLYTLEFADIACDVSCSTTYVPFSLVTSGVSISMGDRIFSWSVCVWLWFWLLLQNVYKPKPEVLRCLHILSLFKQVGSTCPHVCVYTFQFERFHVWMCRVDRAFSHSLSLLSISTVL